MKQNNNLKIQIIIIITGLILFLPYLGAVHLFDWDEINFAEAAREMLVTGDYLTVRVDFQPFHEKPPFFIWLQALSMHIFGVTEFAARLPNAITGIISILILFNIGKRIFDEKFGLLWVIAYIGSLLPHFYFKSGIIDPVFNLFMFLGIYYLSDYYFQKINIKEKATKSPWKSIILAAVFVNFAVLTKGPVGYLLPVLTWIIFAIIQRKTVLFPTKQFVVFTLIAGFPTLLWYAIIIIMSDAIVVGDFIRYQIRLLTTQDAGHGGPIYYHLVVLFFGCFPASIFLLRSFLKQETDNSRQRNFKLWNLILLSVVIVVFSLVNTKIIHYSSLAYFPITFLAAYAIHSIIYRENKWKTSTTWLIGIFGTIFSLMFIALPFILMNIDNFKEYITDEFTLALLETDVKWTGAEYFTGVFYLFATIFVIVLFIRKQYLKGSIAIFGATAIVMFTFLPMLAPKIEPYTQGAPIEFYKQLEGKECYVDVLGFKSYAHYFYTKKPEHLSAYYLEMNAKQFEEWLLTGNIDKTAYFVTKLKKEHKYLENPEIQLLYYKNGFVFLKREPSKFFDSIWQKQSDVSVQ